jgi:hypothetical protein
VYNKNSVLQRLQLQSVFTGPLDLEKDGLLKEVNFNLRRDVNSKNNRHWSTENPSAFHGALDTTGSAVTFRILMDPLF